ncbi:Putative glycosyltransferase 34, nucleotide-diphospho-sugar transferase [Colletotrichum destructivum]|uniref:Glycosyltransferase 34, nucleotide-diphospho-sugar transferase n=1 Tax=Colletotrichum destructivum TaxID=34406 RepID=A0AAX4IS70_9PEZI|nr:Putative glycosyltransferase 34, nucleotide-diphospho-sugar transferase [Colletotrichum destructivum]
MNRPKFLQVLVSPLAIKVFVSIVLLLTAVRTLMLYTVNSTTTRIDHVTSSHPPNHREHHCLPPTPSDVLAQFETLKSACPNHPASRGAAVRVTTATAHFGKVEKHYQDALQTHVMHTMLHGQRLEVMCSPLVDDLWNKPAFLLSMLLDEMLKPRRERAEWIFWVDRDTIILDQCRPASSFLPPSRTDGAAATNNGEGEKDGGEKAPDDQVQLLATKDWNGLNNGVFLLRVGQWAVELFSAVLAFRHYRPDVELPFTEQSAMGFLIGEPEFEKGVQFVPQTWFNAYPGGNASTFLEREDEAGLADYQARRGDFLVHFAGVGERGKAMDDWVGMLQRNGSSLAAETWRTQRNASRAIMEFWGDSAS